MKIAPFDRAFQFMLLKSLMNFYSVNYFNSREIFKTFHLNFTACFERAVMLCFSDCWCGCGAG